MNYISQNLKFYRSRNRFRQQEIADKLKVTLGMVKTYEAGTAPPVETMIRIADMMHITLDTLVRTKLTAKNFLEVKDQSAPGLLERLESLEIAVNKIVNKKQNK